MLDFLRTHVYRKGECLLWAGTCNPRGGHPRISWLGRKHYARRVLFELSVRPLRKGEYVVVTCDEERCMNIEHLKPSTRRGVRQAMKDRGTAPGGTAYSIAIAIGKSAKAKLPIQERGRVMEMLANGKTMTDVAREYGITYRGVHAAITRWKRIFGGELQLSMAPAGDQAQPTNGEARCLARTME